MPMDLAIMTYPLFDCGYTLWIADLDTRLMDRFGQSAKMLGIDSRLLRDGYYRGASAASLYDQLRAGLEQDDNAA